MKPAYVTTLFVAALLSGIAVRGLIGRAAAEPVSVEPAPELLAPMERPARVYLFRGFAGMVFSRGMDALAERIQQAGFAATVNEAVLCPVIAKDAIGDYRAHHAPIVVIGHSVGAACAVAFAEMLEAENISVNLLVTTDPNRIADNVPPNVARYINIFQSNSVLGGGDVQPAKGFSGHYASYDLVEHSDITHLNIEKLESIHDQVLAKIQQLAVTTTAAEGETIPIRLVVPAGAPIELWDSGMPVAVNSADTLQSLAAVYRVPVWALTQINRISDNTTLLPGLRITVPRHLVPLAAASTGPLTGQTPTKR